MDVMNMESKKRIGTAEICQIFFVSYFFMQSLIIIQSYSTELTSLSAIDLSISLIYYGTIVLYYLLFSAVFFSILIIPKFKSPLMHFCLLGLDALFSLYFFGVAIFVGIQ